MKPGCADLKSHSRNDEPKFENSRARSGAHLGLENEVKGQTEPASNTMTETAPTTADKVNNDTMVDAVSATLPSGTLAPAGEIT
jgi:hypothetical protein